MSGVEVSVEALVQARLDAGLSVAEAAENIVTRQALWLIETGKSRPSRSTLRALARRYGRRMEAFIPTLSLSRLGTEPSGSVPSREEDLGLLLGLTPREVQLMAMMITMEAVGLIHNSRELVGK